MKERKRKAVCPFFIMLMDAALVNINGDTLQTLEIVVLLTVVSLLPSILIMMTSFTRTIIVISFLRSAMGTQQTPPNMVLVGIAIFLTLFIMQPTLTEINEVAYEPYVNEEITLEVAIDRASDPLRSFMLRQTDIDALNLFLDFSETPRPANDAEANELSLMVVVPAFMTSELSRAFTMGFLLYIPFLLIDIVVSSTLMSVGMIMLPPAMIAMPFKLLLFIVVNGWEMLFSSIVISFTG